MSFLESYVEENLKDPEFAKEWADSELEYTLARNIIRQRNRLGLTQSEVALRMHTKQNVVSRIENGSQNVTLKSLKLLAAALQTDVPSLMQEYDEKQDEQKTSSDLVKS
ncbi:helix-turn-helix domain-containing protein [Planococcus sp. CAU13]|uniref:helix-turn-helix domain-containing protein n=1 Tax=Planococcus sp. CAU13 TaxID=1541197 RepID=UPI00068B37AB|nr:helix-turn-helix transcriptional regulator [Planococcus sp. CAU13]